MQLRATLQSRLENKLETTGSVRGTIDHVLAGRSQDQAGFKEIGHAEQL